MAIVADLKGNRIYLKATRTIRALDDVVPGAYFSKSGGAHWTVPLSLPSIRRLRKRFGDELKLSEDLETWGRSKLRTDKYLADLARQERAEIGIARGTLEVWESRYPKLAEALRGRGYQTVGSRFVAEGRQVLIADSVGLGKTAQTLGGIMESGVPGPYLVICPKTAGPAVWKPEIERWLPGHVAAPIPEGSAIRHKYLKRALVTPKRPVLWIIINPWMLKTKNYWQCNKCQVRTLVNRKKKKELGCGHNPARSKTIQEHEFPELFQTEWGAIVIDESHRVVIKRSKSGTQTREGGINLQSVEGGLRICQSGTPFDGNPPLLFGTLNWLRQKEYSAYWPWVRLYWDVSEGYGNSLEVGELKDPKGLQRSLRGIMLRRTRAEVAPHLPPRQYLGTPHPEIRPDIGEPPVGVWLEMSSQQRKVYEEMVEMSVARLENGDLDAIGHLAELTRLRQFATCYARLDDKMRWEPALPSNKWDYLMDVALPELGFDDGNPEKVVIVSQFTKVLNLFARELDHAHGRGTSCLVTGQVTGTRRAEAIDRFNSTGKPWAMFLNTDAGGESITLDAADEMIFLDEDHNPDVQEQVEGRIDNRRPEEKIVRRRYRYLRSLGTIEEEIALAVAARGFSAQKVFRDGSKFTRKILKMQ